MLKTRGGFYFLGDTRWKLKCKITEKARTEADERNSSKRNNWRRASGGRALERRRSPALGPDRIQSARGHRVELRRGGCRADRYCCACPPGHTCVHAGHGFPVRGNL